MSILVDIIANKRIEVERGKSQRPVEHFEKDPGFRIKGRSLAEALNAGGAGIIGEFKRKSPSKGWFKAKEFECGPVVKDYARFGAAGISVLTDEVFFGGSVEDLVEAKKLTGIPVLRKDFIIDRWQVAESKILGADVILLIAACLSRAKVKELAVYARNSGLETLLEIHNEKELDHICDEVGLVGVNNRDLETFEVNMETSYRLIDQIRGKPAIAESGIHDVEVIIKLREAGFKGFLIGERFMNENDPGQAFRDFAAGLKPN